MAKLLVIEDELHIRKMLTRTLRCEGFDVAAAENGRIGVQMALEDPPDLIISDVMMPELDGYGVIKALQEEKRTAAIPFIFLTALADQQSLRLGMRLGADDYLVKPVDLKELLSAIQTRLARHSVVQQWRNDLHLSTARLSGGGKRAAAGAVAAQPACADRIIGNYRLLKTIGEGAWGIVFLCESLSDGQRYAMKILKLNFLEDISREVIVRRFANEAKAASQLKHPNIVNFIEFGYQLIGNVQSPYIVMEYFPGYSLSWWLDNGVVWDFRRKVAVILQVACALAAVHAKNIIHRDIKPGNILVDENFNVKITDFGICHLPCSDLTITTNILGTPCYLSPEYLATGKADQLADIYSLGVVAYELLLGVRPFTGNNLSSLMSMIQEKLPPEPLKLRPDFPLALQNILAKMLKKKPQWRYQTISALVDDLVLFENSPTQFSGLLGRVTKRFVAGKDWS